MHHEWKCEKRFSLGIFWQSPRKLLSLNYFLILSNLLEIFLAWQRLCTRWLVLREWQVSPELLFATSHQHTIGQKHDWKLEFLAVLGAAAQADGRLAGTVTQYPVKPSAIREFNSNVLVWIENMWLIPRHVPCDVDDGGGAAQSAASEPRPPLQRLEQCVEPFSVLSK